MFTKYVYTAVSRDMQGIKAKRGRNKKMGRKGKDEGGPRGRKTWGKRGQGGRGGEGQWRRGDASKSGEEEDLIVDVEAEGHPGMECRLGFLCGIDVGDLLAGHETLLVVNGGINAAIPAKMDLSVRRAVMTLGFPRCYLTYWWKLASCQPKVSDGGHVL